MRSAEPVLVSATTPAAQAIAVNDAGQLDLGVRRIEMGLDDRKEAGPPEGALQALFRESVVAVRTVKRDTTIVRWEDIG